MKRFITGVLFLLGATNLQAQKVEQGLDFFFKPTDNPPRYYAITEKKEGRWHRKAYYLPEKTLALEGWYKDADCKLADGEVSLFYLNRSIKSKGLYSDGKRQGLFLSFHDNGILMDSAHYVGDALKGIKLGWNKEGMQIDSMNFDGAGNGTEVNWYGDGVLASAGYWTADTVKKGRWKYYHPNGQLKATEEYANGKRTSFACFNDAGQPLDPKDCEEREAVYAAKEGWGRFLGRKLKSDVPVKMGAPAGEYMVVVQFIVGKDGRIENIEALTKFGYGMEEEVIRTVQLSPKWEPALQYGQPVRAYRRQPITFVVSKG